MTLMPKVDRKDGRQRLRKPPAANTFLRLPVKYRDLLVQLADERSENFTETVCAALDALNSIPRSKS